MQARWVDKSQETEDVDDAVDATKDVDGAQEEEDAREALEVVVASFIFDLDPPSHPLW